MDEFMKLLDPHFNYDYHYIDDENIYITVSSNRQIACCPYCGGSSSKIHSVYSRSFQDLPLQGKKVIVLLKKSKVFLFKSRMQSYDFLRTI